MIIINTISRPVNAPAAIAALAHKPRLVRPIGGRARAPHALRKVARAQHRIEQQALRADALLGHAAEAAHVLLALEIRRQIDVPGDVRTGEALRQRGGIGCLAALRHVAVHGFRFAVEHRRMTVVAAERRRTVGYVALVAGSPAEADVGVVLHQLRMLAMDGGGSETDAGDRQQRYGSEGAGDGRSYKLSGDFVQNATRPMSAG